MSSTLVIGAITTFTVIPQAYAVSNAAATSHALRDTTKNPADGAINCTARRCILMSSDGVAGNDNHGVFFKHNLSGSCLSPSTGTNGSQFVALSSAMTSTSISTLSFGASGSSSLCNTPSTWHIFRTTATTPNTYWAVKLDGSANMPATLDSSNFQECSPTGNFDTATGCTAAPPSPNAPTVLSATAASATQINLSWTDNSSDETGFKIESPAGTAITTTAANATTYSRTGLTCNTNYTFAVKATNANGDSSSITANATTSACSAAVSAPIFNFNRPAEIFASEVEQVK